MDFPSNWEQLFKCVLFIFVHFPGTDRPWLWHSDTQANCPMNQTISDSKWHCSASCLFDITSVMMSLAFLQLCMVVGVRSRYVTSYEWGKKDRDLSWSHSNSKAAKTIVYAKLPKLTLDIVVTFFSIEFIIYCNIASIIKCLVSNVFLVSFVFNHSMMIHVSLAFTSLIYLYASCPSFFLSFSKIAILCFCDLCRR